MFMSQTSAYAVRALAYLAQQQDRAFHGAREIADAIGAPPNYLGKTLQSYVRADILDARRGKTGGVRLAVDPEEITLWEVLDAIQGLSDLDRCPLGNAVCDNANACGIHTRWSAIKTIYSDMLRSTTLDSVARGELK
jgi:Rrf2 family transcriptional regulator, iron-sulfur cluster assembly transcription factor